MRAALTSGVRIFGTRNSIERNPRRSIGPANLKISTFAVCGYQRPGAIRAGRKQENRSQGPNLDWTRPSGPTNPCLL